MDTFTLNHLQAFADTTAYDDEREAFMSYALAALADDPELADYGWRSLFDAFRNEATS